MQETMDRAWLAKAVELARELWKAYLIEPSEDSVQFIVDTMDPQLLSLIGTGKHEFYADLASFFTGLERDQEEAQDVVFEILDEYYEPRPIGVDSCLVFGTLWVRERPDQPKPLLVEMDTRFTLVFRRDGDRLLLTHLHHSTPNIDQRREEYYPKTATEQANAALEHSKAMERRAELDSMTELLNHAAFEKHVATALIEGGEGNAFFMIDLDDFKTVNDTLGHPEGDRVIAEFADVLQQAFPRDALIGRMGGDEFAVFSTCPLSVADAEDKARQLIEAWGAHSAAREVELGCSVGIVRVVRGRTFFDIYRAADQALYASKGKGKARFSW
ncbi:diguanylate cyclase [Eggerthella guodeyinii]|uniref:Diguanylate cyclase n=1 Tax=Eggerthella guodeyinii TaxID=2690837 RepID=A0A6L7IM67_9ACTN|nr:diguanylate cyclase [Eggerthella guodeyinii]QOS68363.1 diguanylate cyclase [Eggerthella guodeyinii]